MAVYCQLLLLSLLWSLVEVHSQSEYPYVSFMGQNLTRHSYVDLTLVGTDDSDPGNTVRCITDLDTCCGSVVWVSIVETGISLVEIDCKLLHLTLMVDVLSTETRHTGQGHIIAVEISS